MQPSKHDTANSGSTLKGFEFQKFSQTKELYQWNASFDRFRGISVHRSPVQADSASPVVGYFRFHCLH